MFGEIYTTLNFLWLQRKNFVALCTDDWNTAVSFDDSLKDFNGTLSNRAPIAYNFYPVRTRHVCPKFSCKNGSVFWNLFTLWCSDDFERTETPRKRIINFPGQFLYIASLYRFPKAKSFYIQQMKLDCVTKTSDDEMYPRAAIRLAVFRLFSIR